MSYKPTLWAGWKAYRPSKAIYFWSCVACVTTCMIVGFSWGGWQTAAGTARHARREVSNARVQLLADICVSRFRDAKDAAAEFVALMRTEPWQRSEFIREGGWVNLPSTEQPVVGASVVCVRRLLSVNSPATGSFNLPGTGG